MPKTCPRMSLVSLGQDISGSNLLWGAANPLCLLLLAFLCWPECTLAGGQNETRPESGWQDPEVEEGRSCPVLMVRERNWGGGKKGTCCWWGWEIVKPLWQTACKFLKELHRETQCTQTQYIILEWTSGSLWLGHVFPACCDGSRWATQERSNGLGAGHTGEVFFQVLSANHKFKCWNLERINSS